MKDKKEEQAKKWRELRKRQNSCGKNIVNFTDNKEDLEWERNFEPLSEDEQRGVALFLQDAYRNCIDDHYDKLKELGKEYLKGKNQSLIGYLEKQCYMAMGRETIYELLLAVLCPRAVDKDYRGYVIKTAKEWKAKDDETKA